MVSIGDVPKVSIIGQDKSVHSFFYFVFSILWFLFLTKEMPEWSFARKAILVVLSALVYGAVIEVCQEQFTASRKADLFDILANVTGSVIAIIVLFVAEKIRKRNTIKNTIK
ncbi:hypothetical protein FSS13T_04670 [Flavobacterium saliperosum S13]|uniref:VanZ-like domain-containing protein n=1 Tax=Flavobacterium saliperosum S13 TaxID=1341155 RepID=A0ABP2ZZH7_9FLAO|nr:hypothetical protein FSS13T_04670 [Flavobacterium saliperosum S13]